MKIPTGEFGYRTPDLAPAPSVGPGAFVGQQGLAAVGQGLTAVGETEADIARDKATQLHQEQLQQAAEAKQLAAEARRAQAMTASAQAQNDLNDAQDQISNQVLEGKIKGEDALKLWGTTSKEIIDAKAKGLDDANGRLLQAGLEPTAGALTRSLGHAITQRNRQEVGASVNSYEEEMSRLFLKDPVRARTQMMAVFDAQGPLAGLNPEQIGKRKQQFVETSTFNASSQYLTQNMNNAKALNAFIQKLPELDELDPAKKNILESKAMSMVTRLEAKAERAAASRLATVGAEVSAVDSMILKGYEPDAQTMNRLAAISKGTPYEKVVEQQVAFNKQTAAFRAAPPLEKERFMSEFESEVRKNPTPEGIATLEKMKTIQRAQGEEIKKDVITYGQKNNLADIPPIDFSKPNLGEQIAARVPYLRGMKAQYRAPMEPLSDAETQQIVDGMQGLQPAAKAAALRELSSKIPDGEVVRGLAAQIAPKDKGMSTALMLASRDLQTTKGRLVAELYIRGQDAIKTKSAKIDEAKETGIRAQLARDLEGVYLTAEGRDAAIDASINVYAGMKADGDDDLARAVRLSTGGLMRHNGGKIAKPYGWSDSQFSDGLSRVTADDLKAAGGGDKFRVGKDVMTAEQLRAALPGAQLQTVDDGVYAIKSDAGLVRRADGRTLLIKVH